MVIKDETLLAEFRAAWRCEWCKRWSPHGCDPHHVFSRGAGRLDVRINLVSLCRACHQAHHAGQIPLRCDLLAIVATREGVNQFEIEDEIYRLRRTRRKHAEPDE